MLEKDFFLDRRFSLEMLKFAGLKEFNRYMSKLVISKVSEFFPAFNKKAILITALLMCVVLAIPLSGESNRGDSSRISLPLDLGLENLLRQISLSNAETVASVDKNAATMVYQIKKGDMLSTIFDDLGLGQKVMYQILEVDENVLAFDTLMPGSDLKFWINPKNGRLDKLELYYNSAQQVIFSRIDNTNHFEFEEIQVAGKWLETPIGGEINGSFSSSAIRAGATAAEAYSIVNLLKEKINFSRDLRAGDTFQFVRRSQFIAGKPTGNTEISSFRINNHGEETSIYLFDDGIYYMANGENLQKAFNRYPTKKRYRVTSRFNPRRLHPVTGRISPHNGVDFGTPSGTPLYATGDGVITTVKNHRYAGKYIVVKHSNKYSTRYLHLSRFKVRKGQHVKRGQLIGYSGATGRITGPHLHFEFRVYNRPTNPLTVKIPMAKRISAKDKAKFKTIMAKNNKILNKVAG